MAGKASQLRDDCVNVYTYVNAVHHVANGCVNIYTYVNTVQHVANGRGCSG